MVGRKWLPVPKPGASLGSHHIAQASTRYLSEFLTVADFNESSFTARGPSNKKGAH